MSDSLPHPFPGPAWTFRDIGPIQLPEAFGPHAFHEVILEAPCNNLTTMRCLTCHGLRFAVDGLRWAKDPTKPVEILPPVDWPHP